MSKSVLDTRYSVKKCLIDSLSVLFEVTEVRWLHRNGVQLQVQRGHARRKDETSDADSTSFVEPMWLTLGKKWEGILKKRRY